LFVDSRTLYTAYGGARGGGKTHAVRYKAVGGAIRYEGIRILIIRRTYPELQQNHIEPIQKMVPQQLAKYNGTLHTMYFWNGSTINFGHYSGIASETEYQGQEYDWIFLDEATQFTEREFRFLGALLRGVNDIPKRFYITCNPGGVGHRWVKRLFIDKQYKTESINPEENENPKDYTFIPATVEDNTYLMASSPAYVQMLSALPENLRQAHRYGNWDALAGTYFPEFSEAKHVITPFPIPAHWIRYRAFDYGLDMFAPIWITEDENGRSYVYREYNESNLIVSAAADALKKNTGVGEHIAITFCPPDMWNRQKDTGKTMAEDFMMNGIGLVKADNNRVQGWLQVKEKLADMPDGKPGLLIFDTCKELIANIQAIQADEKNPNDCAKEPHDITHNCDALRYYCISRTLPSEAQQTQEQYNDDDNDEDYDEHMTGGEATASYLNY
jgi:phage terminase large subunit